MSIWAVRSGADAQRSSTPPRYYPFADLSGPGFLPGPFFAYFTPSSLRALAVSDCRMSAISAQTSARDGNQAATVVTLKLAGSRSAVSSDQSSGIDIGAPLRARVE